MYSKIDLDKFENFIDGEDFLAKPIDEDIVKEGVDQEDDDNDTE